MLLKIIFRDGSTADLKDAARMILNYERPGYELKAIYQDETGSQFETFVFWRQSRNTFFFNASSGDILASFPLEGEK
jgi:hypothetical protein